MNRGIPEFVVKYFTAVHYIKSFFAFLRWAQKKYPGQPFSVFVDIGFFDFKFVFNKKNIFSSYSDFDFIFCKQDKKTTSLNKIGLIGAGTYGTDWHQIFSSYQLEIWENKKRHSVLPIRFGLNPAEKMQALSIVRESARKFLDEGKNTSKNPTKIELSSLSRLKEPCTICIAIWVHGEVRGSVIIQDLPLREGLVQAGENVCIDRRFKPISFDELGGGRIEITIISDLFMPISRYQLKEKVINPALGYLIKNDTKIGWYVPEVFNCVSFMSLAHLITDLASKKARMNSDESMTATIYNFSVDDFIESNDKLECFDIDITVPTLLPTNTMTPLDIITFVSKAGRGVFDQLISTQELDGNIPSTLNPLTGREKQIGWTQLACTVWAMTTFGRVIQDDVFLQSAKKSFVYLCNTISMHKKRDRQIRVYALPYLVRASANLNEEEKTHLFLKVLFNETEQIEQYEPILFANVASVFAEHGSWNNTYLQKAIHFAGIVQSDFEQRLTTGTPIDLARYPELISALLALEKATNDHSHADTARKMLDWLITYQLPNGAFPGGTYGHPLPYTRGTGKIFEVMTLQYEKYHVAIQSALLWLAHMQYSDESMYFIKPELHNKVRGGLRHDYKNPELWIDGSAHFLIGISRMIQQIDTKNNVHY